MVVLSVQISRQGRHFLLCLLLEPQRGPVVVAIEDEVHLGCVCAQEVPIRRRLQTVELRAPHEAHVVEGLIPGHRSGGEGRGAGVHLEAPRDGPQQHRPKGGRQAPIHFRHHREKKDEKSAVHKKAEKVLCGGRRVVGDVGVHPDRGPHHFGVIAQGLQRKPCSDAVPQHVHLFAGTMLLDVPPDMRHLIVHGVGGGERIQPLPRVADQPQAHDFHTAVLPLPQ
mmetsp:Transcript_43060/g.71763  ORF Transcript_43060/g.71763 Transcript_43060/m.71763 type:complete len:224 (+) Transcript_43060:215-886(+)